MKYESLGCFWLNRTSNGLTVVYIVNGYFLHCLVDVLSFLLAPSNPYKRFDRLCCSSVLEWHHFQKSMETHPCTCFLSVFLLIFFFKYLLPMLAPNPFPEAKLCAWLCLFSMIQLFKPPQSAIFLQKLHNQLHVTHHKFGTPSHWISVRLSWALMELQSEEYWDWNIIYIYIYMQNIIVLLWK